MWSVDNILKAVDGTVHGVERRRFSAISTDSRSIGKGEFFVPLKGPNFDGHDFIESAYERSGGGSLCDRTRSDICKKTRGTLVLVDDTNEAFLDLARYKRKRTPCTFIGITGSNGKTTTKELLIHIIGDLFAVAFNEKNYNNQVGVAKTMLAIAGRPKYGIFELGTNQEGEIGVLTGIVQPHVSLITNVNASHLEGLRDVQGVLREKLSLFQGTVKKGHIFINADDASLAPYVHKSSHAFSTFGIREEADFSLRVTADRGLQGFDITLALLGETITTRTRLLGRHNLYNVLAAATLARFIGVDCERVGAAIAAFEPYKGRFRPGTSPRGFTVVDDSYNANPASMEWAIDTLSALPCNGRRIAVLGSMKELGEKERHYHQELGRSLNRSSLSLVILLGEEMKAAFHELNNGRARFFQDKGALIDFLSSEVGRGDLVLVKGSRALGMDKIVEGLT